MSSFSLAADRRTKQDLANMRATLADIQPHRGGPMVEDFVAHRRFHRTVYGASHNDLLISTLEGMWDKVDRYRLIGPHVRHPPQEQQKRAREHQELVAAIVAGDAPGAAQVMHDHIRGSLGAAATTRQTAFPAG